MPLENCQPILIFALVLYSSKWLFKPYPGYALFFLGKLGRILAQTRLRYQILLFKHLQLLMIVLHFLKSLVSLLQPLEDDFELPEETVEFFACLLVVEHEILVVLSPLGMTLLNCQGCRIINMALRVYLDCLGTQSSVHLCQFFESFIWKYLLSMDRVYLIRTTFSLWEVS